jgi:hypothetical protein
MPLGMGGGVWKPLYVYELGDLQEERKPLLFDQGLHHQCMQG